MREPVLNTFVQRQRVADVEPHGLASAGDGYVQRCFIVAGQLSDHFRDGIGGTFVVTPGADVIERLASPALQHHDVLRPELDRGQPVVGPQPVEPTGAGVQE